MKWAPTHSSGEESSLKCKWAASPVCKASEEKKKVLKRFSYTRPPQSAALHLTFIIITEMVRIGRGGSVGEGLSMRCYNIPFNRRHWWAHVQLTIWSLTSAGKEDNDDRIIKLCDWHCTDILYRKDTQAHARHQLRSFGVSDIRWRLDDRFVRATRWLTDVPGRVFVEGLRAIVTCIVYMSLSWKSITTYKPDRVENRTILHWVSS